MQRRELLIGAGLMAAAGTVWVAVRQSAAADVLGAGAAPTTDALLDAVCDLVIPDTDTPGARSAGVPQFMVLAMQHGLAGTTDEDRSQLESLLNAAAGSSFVALSHERQLALLTDVDAKAYATPGSVWPRIKQLVLMGYYSSQIGASQELQYQLVPGRYDTDLPVKPGDRAWSSDWLGQGF
jgi:hypothetical protein